MILASGRGVGDCLGLLLAICFRSQTHSHSYLRRSTAAQFRVQFFFYWKSLFSSMLRLDFCFILVGESVTGGPLLSSLSLHLVDILSYRI